MTQDEGGAPPDDPTAGMVCRLDDQADVLFIAFGGIRNQIDQIPPFEFLGVLGDTPVSSVFVRDLDQSWYQRGVRGESTDVAGTVSALRQVVARSGARRVVTLGASAGGFAAILFGVLLDADHIVAFGPQTFITRRHRLWYRDRRWSGYIRSLRRHNPSKVYDLRPVLADGLTAKTTLSIHIGLETPLDVVHADRLRSFGGVEIATHDSSHHVAKYLRDNELLAPILQQAAGL